MGKSKRRIRPSAFIRTAPVPNKEMMAGYFHRAKSLKIEEAYIDGLVKKINGGKNPQQSAEFLEFVDFHPRAKILERLRELREFLPLERFVTLKQTAEYCFKMYFNDSDQHAFIVKEDYVLGAVSRSLRFGSRQKAVDAFFLSMLPTGKAKHIIYTSFVQIVPSVTSD